MLVIIFNLHTIFMTVPSTKNINFVNNHDSRVHDLKRSTAQLLWCDRTIKKSALQSKQSVDGHQK